MTKHEIGTLASKILGVYFMANGVIAFGNAFVILGVPLFGSLNSTGIGQSFQTRMLLTMMLPASVQLLVGMLIWRKAPSIARRMTPAEE